MEAVQGNELFNINILSIIKELERLSSRKKNLNDKLEEISLAIEGGQSKRQNTATIKKLEIEFYTIKQSEESNLKNLFKKLKTKKDFPINLDNYKEITTNCSGSSICLIIKPKEGTSNKKLFVKISYKHHCDDSMESLDIDNEVYNSLNEIGDINTIETSYQIVDNCGIFISEDLKDIRDLAFFNASRLNSSLEENVSSDLSNLDTCLALGCTKAQDLSQTNIVIKDKKIYFLDADFRDLYAQNNEGFKLSRECKKFNELDININELYNDDLEALDGISQSLLKKSLKDVGKLELFLVILSYRNQLSEKFDGERLREEGYKLLPDKFCNFILNSYTEKQFNEQLNIFKEKINNIKNKEIQSFIQNEIKDFEYLYQNITKLTKKIEKKEKVERLRRTSVGKGKIKYKKNHFLRGKMRDEKDKIMGDKLNWEKF